MDIETLTKVADSLAEATGRAGDTAPEDGSEAQVEISLILTSLAERLGDEDGPAFLRMYARACDRADANPLVLDASGIMEEMRAAIDRSKDKDSPTYGMGFGRNMTGRG